MQHTQQNYSAVALAGIAVLALIFAGTAAYSAGRETPAQPDPILRGPILDDGARGPCDPALDQADVTPGVDVNGRPVASADLPIAPVHIEGQIAVPLKPARGKGGNSAYVMVDGRKLDPLLNPSACR